MLVRRFAGFAAMFAAAGCYSLRPAAGEPPPAGTRMAFGLNDEGRVAMGGTMGPEIDQIEGSLLDASNGEYVVAVRSIRFLRGGNQAWAGERVQIKREHVRTAFTRHFSRGRTVVFVASTAGAVALFMAARSAGLIAIGGENDRNPDRPPSGSLRIRTWTP